MRFFKPAFNFFEKLLPVWGAAFLYYLTGKAGLLLALPPGFATPVWIPSGLAVALLLLRGKELLSGIFLGSVLVNLPGLLSLPGINSVQSLAIAGGIAAGSTLQALFIYSAVSRFTVNPFSRVYDVLMFAGVAISGCLIAPTLGVASLYTGGWVAPETFFHNWSTWWAGDMAGILVFTPLIVTWSTFRPEELTVSSLLKSGIFLGAFALVSYGIFGDYDHHWKSLFPLPFVLLPFVVWAPLLAGQRGVSASVLLVSGVAIWGTLQGRGPFVTETQAASLLRVQHFIAIISLTGLTLGAALKERRQAQRSIEFLARAGEILSSSLDYETTLKSVARLAVPHFADWCLMDLVKDHSLHRVALAHPEKSKEDLGYELSRRYPPQLGSRHGAGSVIRTGKPELISRIPRSILSKLARNGKDLEVFVKLQPWSYMCLPLSAGNEIVGALTLISAESGRCYDSDALTAAQSLAHRAAMAIENARLFYSAQQEVKERIEAEGKLQKAYEKMEEQVYERTQELSRTHEALAFEMAERLKAQSEILEISEREQKRLGQDLHDSLAQQLVGLSLMQKTLHLHLMNQSISEAREDALSMLGYTTRLIDETKRLSRGFYPIELEKLGFFPALQDLAVSTQHIYQTSCLCYLDDSIEVKDFKISTHLYRIVQESIHNAVKHGKAKEILVSFRKSGNELILRIQDNGSGFLELDLHKSAGMGVRIMQYRAKMAGASFHIEAGKEGGSLVSVKLPADFSK